MTNEEIKELAQKLTERRFERDYGYLGNRLYGYRTEECHGFHEMRELRPKYQDIYDDLYKDFLNRLNQRYL